MSIATELTLLANSKQAIKNSINQKGGSITDSTPFADYSTAIDNLPSGGDNSTLIDLIEGDITTLNIPSGTTMIGSYGIANKPNLTSVTIPNSVTSIGNGAFQSCSSLTSVTIPNSVTSIGNSVFSNCTSLTSVTIPNGVTSIESSLFYYCKSLSSVTIPSSVTTIKSQAFYECSNLKSLTIPSSVTQIGDSNWGNGVFSGCSKLNALICLPTTPPTAMNLALNYTSNYIYVPASALDTYKAASGWSTYTDRLFAIEQVATVDGNPVYNYDLGNTSSTTILSTEMTKLPTGTSIEFAEGVTNMGGSISGYTTVTLPSTFTTFNDQDMIGSSVTTLTMKSTTPPTAERNKFGGSGLTAIYVPYGTKSTYDAAAGWSGFSSIIQELAPTVTSITFVSYNDNANPADWGDYSEYTGNSVIIDAFSATSDSTFDSDFKTSNIAVVEDNLGNDVTSLCTFSSSDYSREINGEDGEGNEYYEWEALDTVVSGAVEAAGSITITATYNGMTANFVINYTVTDNGEPEPDPEEEPEE